MKILKYCPLHYNTKDSPYVAASDGNVGDEEKNIIYAYCNEMMIERKKYLDKLISKKENGLVKVITGICRCGKS